MEYSFFQLGKEKDLKHGPNVINAKPVPKCLMSDLIFFKLVNVGKLTLSPGLLFQIKERKRNPRDEGYRQMRQ